MQRGDIHFESGFAEYFIEHNNLKHSGFAAFLFDRNMLFGAGHQWWGEKRKRRLPHEGLDLCWYLDSDDFRKMLPQNTKVPAALDGEVVAIIDDFLGKSVLVRHGMHTPGKFLVTISAHVAPEAGIESGVSVREGQLIGRLAQKAAKRSEVPPHLHLSAGFFAEDIIWHDISWQNMWKHKDVRLIDPLPFIPDIFRRIGED